MRVPFMACAAAGTAAAFLINKSTPSYLLEGSLYTLALSLFLLQVLAIGTYQWILYPKFFSPLRHLPQPTDGHFLMGQFRRLIRDPSGHPAADWAKTIPNNGIIRYTHAFNKERLLVTSPKALAEVLVHKNYDFVKPKLLREGIGRVLGVGILLAEGDEHKRQRKSLSPSFSFRHIKDLYPIFWAKARESVQAMKSSILKTDADSAPSTVVEIGDWASRATLDIIGVAGMDQDFGAIKDENTPLNKTYRSIFSSNRTGRILVILNTFLPLWFIRRLPTKRNDDVVNAVRFIRGTCYKLIADKRSKAATSEDSKSAGKDILSVAMNSEEFSDDNLVDQLMTFLAAGHETTASSMSWATLLLCQHPQVQSRLRADVHAALPSIYDSNAAPTSADIEDIPYLHAVCNEVLRIYPPVPLTLRMAGVDTSIQGQFVPKGTSIILSPYATNRDPALWGPNADEFNPDRWMGPGKAHSGGADSNYSFLTFLHGPRSCIGQGFAKAEFACLLAAWAGAFEMELEDKDFQVEIGGGITAKPKNGVRVSLRAVEW